MSIPASTQKAPVRPVGDICHFAAATRSCPGAGGWQTHAEHRTRPAPTPPASRHPPHPHTIWYPRLRHGWSLPRDAGYRRLYQLSGRPADSEVVGSERDQGAAVEVIADRGKIRGQQLSMLIRCQFSDPAQQYDRRTPRTPQGHEHGEVGVGGDDYAAIRLGALDDLDIAAAPRPKSTT